MFTNWTDHVWSIEEAQYVVYLLSSYLKVGRRKVKSTFVSKRLKIYNDISINYRKLITASFFTFDQMIPDNFGIFISQFQFAKICSFVIKK